VTVIPITASKSKPKRDETNSSWHIYAALAQYASEHPEMFEDSFYSEFMTQAHAHWAKLFNK
jgi:hypothetical protein